MGGRGAVSGISDKGIKYGEEFKTIMSSDNIKFVESALTKNARIPMETMSAFADRVYVIVGNTGLKSITFYNKSGNIRRQIDLDHKHLGEKPHVHEGDVTNHHKDFKVKIKKSDRMYINKVLKLWEGYKNGQKQ